MLGMESIFTRADVPSEEEGMVAGTGEEETWAVKARRDESRADDENFILEDLVFDGGVKMGIVKSVKMKCES